MPDQSRLTDPEFLRHSVLDFRQMSTFVQAPLIFERADGVHYWDIHGKHYYDGISGIFVVTVGHNNRRVIEAIKAQMERICFAAPLHGTNVPAIEFCDLLARIAPRRPEHGQATLGRLRSHRSGHEARSPVLEASRRTHQVQVYLPLLWIPWGHAGRYGRHRHSEATSSL